MLGGSGNRSLRGRLRTLLDAKSSPGVGREAARWWLEDFHISSRLASRRNIKGGYQLKEAGAWGSGEGVNDWSGGGRDLRQQGTW